MRETSEHDPPESEQDILRELQSDLHPDWGVLAAPLDPQSLDALIDKAIAQRGRSDASPAKVSFLRRHRWVPALVVGGAIAAGLSLVIRTEDPVEPFELEMRPGHTQLRGEAARVDASREYDLRNEPLWTVHASSRMATEGLRLYLVAQTMSGMELLRPQIEQQGAAFRVLGEVGELGLRPGDVTVHFVLGPGASEAEVVSRLEEHLGGATLPSTWQVQSSSIHISAE